MISRILRILERRIIEPQYRKWLRLKNHNKNFTIISNDCWGGGVYEDLNLPYLTPTIGLFFYAECYIEFIHNLKYYLSQDLKFQSHSKYEIDHIDYPIGYIDDIEIHFLHFDSEKHAAEKWNARKLRVNYENIYFKFSDRNLCTDELAAKFDKLETDNKVYFCAKKAPAIKSSVWLQSYKKFDFIGKII